MEIIDFPNVLTEWAIAYQIDASHLKAAYIQGIKAGGSAQLALSRAATLLRHLTGEQETQDKGLLRIVGSLPEPEKDLLNNGDNFKDTGLLASSFLADLDEAISDPRFAQEFVLKHALREGLMTIKEAKTNEFKPTREATEKILSLFKIWQKYIFQITDEKLAKLRKNL